MRDYLICGVLTAALLLPFLGKPYHVDDPMYLWAAQQIREHPIDFYGFEANWGTTATPVANLNKNPPGVSYFLALISLFFGFHFEAAAHFLFLIPAIAVTTGTYAIARRFCTMPLLAAAAVAVSPVFVVSATNVMSDVLMLAFYVWAIACWLRGIEKEEMGWLVAAGILISFSFLTKYFGITLVPLLAAHGYVVRKKAGRWLLPLLIPLATAVAYDLLALSLYGRTLFLGAASFAAERTAETPYGATTVVAIGLSFAGGCLTFVFFFTPLLWTRRGLAALGAGALLALIVFVFAERFGRLPLKTEEGTRWLLVLQSTLFVAAGIQTIALTLTDAARRRDDSGCLLGLWVLGTFVWATYFNWNLTARLILPMAPALAIVTARILEDRGVGKRAVAWRIVPLALSAAVALVIARSDYQWARSQSDAASKYAEEFGENLDRLYFQGHWGWQWYMEEHGAHILNRGEALPRRLLLVVPHNNATSYRPPEESVLSMRIDEIPGPRFAATMSQDLGAGFYLDQWGPLPYSFGRVPTEKYLVYSVDTSR